MDPRQIMIERHLKEYLDSEKAKNLDKYGTPEHVLVLKIMGTVSAWAKVAQSGKENYDNNY